jgi:hypothetical protein
MDSSPISKVLRIPGRPRCVVEHKLARRGFGMMTSTRCDRVGRLNAFLQTKTPYQADVFAFLTKRVAMAAAVSGRLVNTIRSGDWSWMKLSLCTRGMRHVLAVADYTCQGLLSRRARLYLKM